MLRVHLSVLWHLNLKNWLKYWRLEFDSYNVIQTLKLKALDDEMSLKCVTVRLKKRRVWVISVESVLLSLCKLYSQQMRKIFILGNKACHSGEKLSHFDRRVLMPKIVCTPLWVLLLVPLVQSQYSVPFSPQQQSCILNYNTGNNQYQYLTRITYLHWRLSTK